MFSIILKLLSKVTYHKQNREREKNIYTEKQSFKTLHKNV